MPRSSLVRVGAELRTPVSRPAPAAKFPSGRIVAEYPHRLVLRDDPDTAVGLEDVQLLDDPDALRPGVLYRKVDQSGVSGTGVVADFVEFPSGRVVQEWRNEENGNLETRGIRDSGVDFRPSMELAVRIHGHGGNTEYVYDGGEVAHVSG